MINRTPVNRSASIFLSRKKRVETVKEALELFAIELTGDDVHKNIIDMLSKANSGESPALNISITIHRDPKTADKFSCKIRTVVKTEVGGNAFWALS